MFKTLVANWKLNPQTERDAVALAKGVDARGVVICPPFPFLSAVKKVLRKAALGAQDVFWENRGAYTGEVSPSILKSVGVKYVIVGHSERRRFLRETDAMVNKKVKAAHRAGLKVILCVGEPWEIRRKGIKAAEQFVAKQLRKDLGNLISKFSFLNSRLIIAYEPIWAIGTGKADKPRDAVKMARFIKTIVKAKVLYGGSVNARNAKTFLKEKEIDGALVGGASLKAGEFREIVRIVAE